MRPSPNPDPVAAADLLREQGEFAAALDAYRELLKDGELCAVAHFKIGTVHARRGESDQAERAYRQALALRPGYPEAANNLALMHAEAGEREAAEALYRDVLAENPGQFEPHVNLGNLLLDDDRWAEAQYHFRRAVELRPDSGLAHERLGTVLRNRRRTSEAIVAFEQALALAPDLYTAWNNLGTCRFVRGEHAAADAAFERSLQLQPNQSQGWDNWLMLGNFRGLSRAELFARHQAYGANMRLRVLPGSAFPGCRRNRGGNIRVGFVSGDFRRHSVAYFLLGALAGIDRRRFDLHAYPTRNGADRVSERLHPMFAQWHTLVGLSDDAAADRIRDDGIDILIDLSGHTANNRLGVFARRPAPIQVTWLGYPNTTGLDTVDYRIADALADPPGQGDEFWTEEIVRLSRPFLCYTPPPEAPGVTSVPSVRQGCVTFGSFNARVKLGDECLALWSRVLQAVPGSRLLIKSINGADEAVERASMLERLAGFGVESDRVTVLGAIDDVAEHLAAYGEIDVGLDSYPYQGTTTTCEALWMGVPVVALLGDRHASRVAASLLDGLGLGDLLARTADEFVAKAVALAADGARRDSLRSGLRERMRASPLLDPVSMGRELGDLWERMWHRYAHELDTLPATLTAGAETAPPADDGDASATGANSRDPDLATLMRLVDLRASDDVERVAKAILVRRSGHLLALKALVFALISMARFEEALPLAKECVDRAPGDPENLSNLGIVECELMMWAEAVPHFRAAIELSPTDPELHCNLAGAYYRMQKWGEAVPILLKAIELHPGDYVDAVRMLAGALLNARRFEEALTCFEELLKAAPGDAQTQYLCIHARLNICRWDGLPEMARHLWVTFDDAPRLLDSPLMGLSIPAITGRRQHELTLRYSRYWLPSPAAGAPSPKPRDGGRRIRVGYLSGDFRDHPVGYLLPELIEAHDRDRFELFALSIGLDDGSPTRRRLVAAFEHFLDVEPLSVRETVARIRGLDLDLLVDLSGWTSPNRAEALAFRSAPVQAGWLGFAGGSGNRNMWDYVIADPVVIPDDELETYQERVARLPFAYLPVTLPPARATPTRQEEGLSDGAFVYCSFNSFYKFNPAVFDAWCRILARVPASVLWLPRARSSIVASLRAEAEARGVASERLVFAEFREDHEAHLARLSLADLALDPFPYNSHSTGCEILLAGVPMVALRGGTFAGRVGASLLRAARMDELVTDTVEQYIETAVALAEDRARLAALRRRLVEGGERLPLRDMRGFAHALERLFADMVGDAERGVRRHLDASATPAEPTRMPQHPN